MPFSERVYDPETLAMMGRALDEAWQEVLSKSPHPDLDVARIRRAIALCVMQAVDDGVRDPGDLKRMAMLAVRSA